MISNLKIKNFKSIVDQDINLTNLNVLTGLNGSGKSSVLQVLALLKQSITNNSTGEKLFLTGSLVSLGKSNDILSEDSTSDSINFEISLKENDNSSSVIDLKYNVPVSEGHDFIQGTANGKIQKLEQSLRNLQYIQADRIAPKNLYPQAGTFNRDLGWLGSNGEYTIDYINKNEDSTISENRVMIDEYSSLPKDSRYSVATKQLKDQITAWMQEISPGAEIYTHNLDHIDATTLAFKYNTLSKSKSSDRRPTNVGYGLTYSLPIITSCLTAKQGSILLLENPEAHLHPRGQLKLGILLALCAQDGVQIFVETHSDHLLNGIRLATKKNLIDVNNVEVFYFERSYETGVTHIIHPKLQQNGRFLKWPEGFFDEWEKALDELLS